jgi:large subunit ribosomal protein L30
MATKKEESGAKAGGKRIKIKLTSGLVGKMKTHRKVVEALGLKRFNSEVEHVDSPTIRGMVNKVRHLVTVEGEVTAANGTKPKAKAEAK